MDYQSEEDERAIVAAQKSGASVKLQSAAVEIVRATRSHPDLRTGSSVRGAIDLCMVSQELGEIRSLASDDDGVTLDAAVVALSGRVRVREGVSRSAEEIVKELWQSVFHQPDSREADPSAGKATSPTPASRAT